MKLYIGNCSSRFDCNEIINEIKQHTVEPQHGHLELDSSHLFYNDYISQTESLKAAGYTENTVEYRHYYAGKHFSNTYKNILGEIVGAVPLICWVSEIRPGKCVPWHWDINRDEEEHKKLGNLVRYFVFLSPPTFGHIFITENDAYYNEEQGSIYQYPDVHAWHAGSNVGLTSKYLLTLTAYQ